VAFKTLYNYPWKSLDDEITLRFEQKKC